MAIPPPTFLPPTPGTCTPPCGPNSVCTQGQCKCSTGYIETPFGTCDKDIAIPPPTFLPPTQDPCTNVICPQYSTCTNGECKCDAGYKEEGDVDQYPPGFPGAPKTCVRIDPCIDVICPQYSTCTNGECKCDTGYEEESNVDQY